MMKVGLIPRLVDAPCNRQPPEKALIVVAMRSLPQERAPLTSLAMPAPKADVLHRRESIAADLSAIVAGEGVVTHPDGLRPFESDGLTAYRQMPMLVVLPETVAQVSRVLRYCHDNGIRVVPRGSGTSLS